MSSPSNICADQEYIWIAKYQYLQQQQHASQLSQLITASLLQLNTLGPIITIQLSFIR